jgi:hypothetical protein
MSSAILFKDKKGKQFDLTKFRTFIPDNIRENVMEGFDLKYERHILHCSIDDIYEAFKGSEEFTISRGLGVHIDKR